MAIGRNTGFLRVDRLVVGGRAEAGAGDCRLAKYKLIVAKIVRRGFIEVDMIVQILNFQSSFRHLWRMYVTQQ